MKKIIRYIIYGILFCGVIFGFIYIGRYDFKKKNNKSNELVASKFKSLDKNNKFIEVSLDQAIRIVNNDGLLLLANPDSEWSDKYAYILNEAANETNINNIAIIDITVDRYQNNRKYKKLLKALEDYIIYDDLDNATIYMPTFIVIKDGKVSFIDNETSLHIGKTSANDYWTAEKIDVKKNMLIDKIEEYIRNDSHE